MGRMFEDVIEEQSYVVLNTGEPTHQNNNGGMSAIDVSLSTTNLSSKCSWTVNDDTLGSDHLPTFICVESEGCEREESEDRYNIKKADWSMFKEKCNEYMKDTKPTGDIELDAMLFKTEIIMAADDSIPTTKYDGSRNKRVPYWDKECTESVRQRNKARNRANNTKKISDRCEYRRKKGITQQLLKGKSKKYWRGYCSTMTSGTKLGTVWKMAKQMKGNYSSSQIPSLRKNGGYANTQEDKANVLADTFASLSSNSNYSESFKQHREKCEADPNFARDTSTVEARNTKLNQQFTMKEMKAAIHQSKQTSAPGPDNIHYEMLKNIPPSATQILLQLYNNIWTQGIIPEEWKRAEIIPIAKPNKDKQDPSNYRPISLTSVLCKCLERMVNNRLIWHLEENKLLNAAQCGFRKHRGTIDHIIRLQDTILKNIKNDRIVMGVFLDIEKAYDMVWRDGLLNKITNMKINGNMFNFIQDFVRQRTFHVKVAGSRSEVKQLDNGTPQGSVISPTLFMIMINDISTASKDVELSLYADDSNVYSSSTNVKILVKRIQATLDKIQAWCNMWGFKLSTAKSTAVIFTNKRRQEQPTVKLKINDKEIEYQNEVMFLGMIFDSKLTWNKHIEYIVNKCKQRMNLMRSVTGNSWGANKKTLLIIYRALIRSKIDYGAIAYDSANSTLLKRLDKIQYQALKICTGAIYNTSLESLQNECGEAPLNIRRKMQILKTVVKIKTEEEHPAANVLQDHYTLHYGKYKTGQEPTATKAREYLQQTDWSQVRKRQEPKPPWQENIRIMTDMTLREIDIQNIGPSQAKEEMEKLFAKYEQCIQVYTDASRGEDGATAIAYYIPDLQVSRGQRINDNTTVLTAEIHAIKVALKDIGDHMKQEKSCKEMKKIVIFTDSLKAVEAVNNNDTSIAAEMYHTAEDLTLEEINIVWIPSHRKIEGNNIADQIAKAQRYNDLFEIHPQIDQLELKAQIDEMATAEWQSQYTASKQSAWYKEFEPMVSHHLKFSSEVRNKDVQITRLRCGKVKLNEILYKMGMHEDGLCTKCKEPETIEHYLLKCPKSGIGGKIAAVCQRENVSPTVKNILTTGKVIDELYMMMQENKQLIEEVQ